MRRDRILTVYSPTTYYKELKQVAYENLCMYCFEDNGGADICPHCGRDARAAVPQIQLMPGTLIYNDRFLLGRALGQDASGIVYSAMDTKRGVKIRIREYLPRDCARRLNSGDVVPEAGYEDRFDAGLNKLRASVEGVEDPSKRHFFFEENGTGYIAQRKNNSVSSDDTDISEKSGGARMALVVGIAAALVLAVAVGVIALVSFLTNRADNTLDMPRTTGEDIWQPPVSPSPTPYAAATFGVITDPENDWMEFTNPDLNGDESDFATPTPVPTPEGGLNTDKTINEKSSPEVIKKLQKLLINLGWLEKGSTTGKYDAATKDAVRNFQQYMNDTYAINPKLTVDGVAGPKTLKWLIQTDISRRPDPTKAPVTPNPTAADEIIDENASPERIKYVQKQLKILGMLGDKYPNGVYDKTTREAIKKFQMRVNDLQGYDAVREDGVCDAVTMAYLEYYVEWWKQNKPTPAPSKTPAATATIAPVNSPSPEGDYVDENSPAASVKYVQQMLIALGYMDGEADGSYGPKTVDAVKKFQKFIISRHGDKVSVTGKCDAVTLNYLEYYYANISEPTPVPSAGAPIITVTEYDDYDAGVYIVGDSVTVEWKAEGADSYSVYLTDDKGGTVSKELGTKYTSFTLRTDLLTPDKVYTLTVTAIPAGGTEKNGASSYVKVMRAGKQQPTPEPETSKEPENPAPVITVTGALGYTDGVYRVGASGVGISWSCEGAKAFDLSLTDKGDNIVYEQRGTDMSEYRIDPAALKANEKYVFTVTADTGKSASVRLEMGDIATPEPSTTPAADIGVPAITVDGALGYKQDIYWAGSDIMTISWSAEGHVRAYSVYLTNGVGDTLASYIETKQTTMKVDPASMTKEEKYTLTVVAIPEGGDEASGRSASVIFELYTGQTAEPTPEPVGKVEAPVIKVSGSFANENGIYYARRDAMTISWSAKGDVASYDLVITDSDGQAVLEKTGVTKTSRVIDPADMAEGMVYTFTVTAVPKGGTAEDGQSASVQMAIYVEPVLGVPVITVTGHDAVENGDIYMMGANGLDISWHAENAAKYSVYVSRADGKVIKSSGETDQTSIRFEPSMLTPGEVYTVTVVSIAKGGKEKNGEKSSVRMALTDNSPKLEAPVITVEGYDTFEDGVYLISGDLVTVSWNAEGAATYDVYLKDEKGKDLKAVEGTTVKSMNLDTSVLKAGRTYSISITAVPESGKAKDGLTSAVLIASANQTADPGDGETPVPSELAAPKITVSGHKDFSNETYYIEKGKLSISWKTKKADSYSVYLYDTSGNVIGSKEKTAETSMNVKADQLNNGEVYTLEITAYGKNGEVSPMSSVMLARYNGKPDNPYAGGIDRNSDPELIKKLQKALYMLGWLPQESNFVPGTLDAPTVQAVYDMQMYIIENELNPEIMLIDPADPVVDEITIAMIADTKHPVKKPQ